MAPRRKRTVLDDSDSEEEIVHQERKNSLRNFLVASPEKTSKTASNSNNNSNISNTTNASPIRTRSGAAIFTTTPTASPTSTRKARSTRLSPVKASPRADQDTTAASPSSATLSPFHRLLSNRAKNGSNSNSNAKSPCSSPEKKRSNRSGGAKGLFDEKGKSADLVALFSKQAEKAQNSPPKKPPITSRGSFSAEDIASDPISDLDDIDDEDDDDIAESVAVPSSYVGSRAQRRWKNGGGVNGSQTSSYNSSMPLSGQRSGLPAVSASQKFQRPIRHRSSNTNNNDGSSNGKVANNDLRPWSERFAPVNLDELAVHKKKVADVRRWLGDVLRGRIRQRLLVLKGAAGTGKTTTLQLLAKDMDLDVLEWRNPTGSGTSLGFTSTAAQFDEFLNRGTRFTQLDLDEDDSVESDASDSKPKAVTTTASTTTTTTTTTTDDTQQRRKVILIEEFPNTFMRSSSALTGFRTSVLQYLAANTPSLAAFSQRMVSVESIAPVVMIVSETLLTTTSASADSFTAHRLLGPDILRHPGTALIEFNAIAPSLLAKALELVVQKEARKSGRRRTPGPQVLRRLGEVGDIRSAVASLEFLCVKGDDDGDWGAKVAFTKARKGPKDAALTKGEKETLEMVSQREASLGLFHAVGKVVYNKREEGGYPAGSEEAAAETMPDYLADCARPRRPLVSADTLIDETGTDTHTFISALHENYVLSCEQTGPQDPHSSLDYINSCVEYLSESDLLCPTWDIFFGGRGTGRFHSGRDSGSHVLRQDEMAFQVAVRGLLYSLPSPVKRLPMRSGSGSGSGGGSGGGSASSGGAGDQFKMFYPMSLKLWRSREELEALVDVWSLKLLRGETSQQRAASTSTQNMTNRALVFRKPSKAGTHPDAKEKDQKDQKEKNQKEKGQKDNTKTATESAPLLSLGSSARKELLLERLPYMALIARGRRCSFGSMGMRDLEKIVSFHGIGPAATEDDEEDEADEVGTTTGAGSFSAEDAWATDKPTEDKSPRKRRIHGGGPKLPAAQRRTAAEDEETRLSMYKLVLSDDDIEEVD